MHYRAFSLSLLAGLCATATAYAQDFTRAPSYGVVSLATGFTPSPFEVDLQSGGELDSLTVFGLACRGNIAQNPDYRVLFEAGSKPLDIRVEATADTTLIINDPNGDWFCDDDGASGVNPQLVFDQPLSGQYDIWVGTYGDASLQPAKLIIHEHE
ncbi:hypothetical protein [Woodsholea maritima]|uniref:hypothetical protein n=1 Tax=Woodsholea maritima TaxID=240237 RepID=UPI0003A6F37B|nr:hypothetical protein [Woodsholea maritima]